MTTKDNIVSFLKEFKLKAKIFDIIIRKDRSANTQTFLDLDISIQKVKDILLSLNVEDYYKGPNPDNLNKEAELWEFGKKVKGRFVYIKISLGLTNQPVICFSFHFPDREIIFPFKRSNNRS